MSETKPKIENLEQPAQDLTPEQAEVAAGGRERKERQAQVSELQQQLDQAQDYGTTYGGKVP
jgi:hypothetical protein